MSNQDHRSLVWRPGAAGHPSSRLCAMRRGPATGGPHQTVLAPRPGSPSGPHIYASRAVQTGAGGLERLNEDSRDGTLMGHAIITVSMDDGT